MTDQEFQGVIGPSWRESTPWWPPEPTAPEGAPNVVLIVLDDVGYAQLGLLRLRHRHAEHRPARGRRRAARELPHHRAVLTDAVVPPDRAQPPLERDGARRRPRARLPRLLRSHPASQRLPLRDRSPRTATSRSRSASGTSRRRTRRTRPRRARAGRSGAGSSAGTASTAVRPTSSTRTCSRTTTRSSRPSGGDDYHLSEDLADRAIQYVGDLRAVEPDKPFFLYFATGACHSPHHAPPEWIERYQGRFDRGWDAWRDATFARQQELGLLPESTQLSPRPHWVPAWDDARARGPGGGGAVHGVLRRLPLPRRRADRPAARVHRGDRRVGRTR